AQLTVAARALVSLTVTPNPANVPLGLTLQMAATGTYSDSSTADLTSSATWVSVTTAVATISQTGLVTTILPGNPTTPQTTTIRAQVGAVISSNVTLTVGVPVPVSIAVSPTSDFIPNGASTTFTATETLSNGTVQTATGLTWNSSSTSIA